MGNRAGARDQSSWTISEPISQRASSADAFEVVDGRWGASLWIGPPPADPKNRRPWPLLLYDVWADPWALHPISEQRPDLVAKYTKILEDTWKDHQALAKRFTSGGQTVLTPEQLQRLRALGYIR